MEGGGNEEGEVESDGSKVFGENDLPGVEGSGEEGLEGAGAFFFGEEAHGDEGEDEEEVEPEVGGVEGDVNEGLSDGLVGETFHGGGEGEALHEGDEGENDPTEDGIEVALQFLAVEIE